MNISVTVGTTLMCTMLVQGCGAKVYPPATEEQITAHVARQVADWTEQPFNQSFDRNLFVIFDRLERTELGPADQVRPVRVFEKLPSSNEDITVEEVRGNLREFVTKARRDNNAQIGVASFQRSPRGSIETTAFTRNPHVTALRLANEACGLPPETNSEATKFQFDYPYIFGLEYYSYECPTTGKDPA